MKNSKFKVGDYVFYKKQLGYRMFETIPCIVAKSTSKRLTLDDGFNVYKNISPSNCEIQIKES